MTDPAIVLGFDFSLSSTGWARGIFGGTDEAVPDTWGVIKGQAPTGATRLQRIERLQRVRDAVFEIFHSGLPALVMIEDYAFSKGNQAHYIGELGGVLRLALHERGYRMGEQVFLVGTLALKKFVTGSGSADKRAMLLGCNKRWGFDDTKASDDVVDAYGLMRIGEALHFYKLGFHDQLTVFQREVVEDLLDITSKKPKGGKKANG